MSRPARPYPTAADTTDDREPSLVWLFFIGLLLSARYLQPTEGAVFGETLWQAQLWLVLAAMWCWRVVRTPGVELRGGLLDVLLWGLVLGHALATIPVFLDGGDRRAAVNLVWEWAGMAATWFLVRQLYPFDSIGRTAVVFAAVMVSLASLGAWQYHVSTPDQAARYGSLRGEEETLADRVAAGEATVTERQRLAVVRDKLRAFAVPEDAGARQRWEDRLQHSTEPLGTFALANTFGGLLAAVLPWLAFTVWQGWNRRERSLVLLGTVVAAGLVMYCLLLTKSRTAWVGLAAGTAVAAGLLFARKRAARPIVVGAAATGVVVFLSLAVVLMAGGLDRQVVSEASKSLQYRLDYWNATLKVLAERPWLGTGPGNFRTHYLEHRLPGASEAIAAPHNLLLDAWTAGGLLSFVLLLALLGWISWRLGRTASQVPADNDVATTATPDNGWSILETGVVAAFPVVVIIGWLAGNGIDVRLAAIAPIAAAALYCLVQTGLPAVPFVAAGAGLAALVVHLLGADGLEFPAVMQSLLLLAAVVDPAKVRPLADRIRLLPAAGFGLLTIGCLLTGTAPVLNSGALTNTGLQLVHQGHPAAERMLSEAAVADHWSLEPKVLLAELATARALAGDSQSERIAAVRRWEAVLAADPRHLHAREQLATLAEHSDAGTVEAIPYLESAVALSPTDPKLRVRLALTFAAVGKSSAAADQADAALQLDNRNRAAGHVDQVLDSVTRTALERLVMPDPDD